MKKLIVVRIAHAGTPDEGSFQILGQVEAASKDEAFLAIGHWANVEDAADWDFAIVGPDDEGYADLARKARGSTIVKREQVSKAVYDAKLKRDSFFVLHVDQNVAAYYRFGWGPWDTYSSGDAPSRLPVASTIQSVIADLIAHFSGDAAWLGTESDPFMDDGFGGMDLAVWRNGRLVAIVIKGPDGEPQATIFRDEDLAGTDD